MTDQSKESGTRHLYLVFLEGAAPQQLASRQQLVELYLKHLQDCAKRAEWHHPFVILDDETGDPVCAYNVYKISGVVQGALINEKELTK